MNEEETLEQELAKKLCQMRAAHDRLRQALEVMPVCTIEFDTPENLKKWIAWKRATFWPDGTVRDSLHEAHPEKLRTPFDIEEDADFAKFGIDEDLDGYE